MSEVDVREGLRVAVLTEPALSFDPDSVIVRARREVGRRRALVGAGAATVAVAVAAVAVPTVLGVPRGSDGSVVGSGPSTAPGSRAPRSASAVPTQPSVPWPLPKYTPVKYTAEDLANRAGELRKVLGERFRVLVPGARSVAVQEFGGEASGQIEDGQTSLNTFVTFTLNGAKSAVHVAIFGPGSGPEPLSECGTGCAVVAQPDGSHIVTARIPAGEGLWVVNVVHYRNDGAVVQVGGYNYDPTGDTAGPTMADAPVTVAQLAALATDPRLSL